MDIFTIPTFSSQSCTCSTIRCRIHSCGSAFPSLSALNPAQTPTTTVSGSFVSGVCFQLQLGFVSRSGFSSADTTDARRSLLPLHRFHANSRSYRSRYTLTRIDQIRFVLVARRFGSWPCTSLRRVLCAAELLPHARTQPFRVISVEFNLASFAQAIFTRLDRWFEAMRTFLICIQALRLVVTRKSQHRVFTQSSCTIYGSNIKTQAADVIMTNSEL